MARTSHLAMDILRSAGAARAVRLVTAALVVGGHVGLA
jgi:hypothetical protein